MTNKEKLEFNNQSPEYLERLVKEHIRFVECENLAIQRIENLKKIGDMNDKNC